MSFKAKVLGTDKTSDIAVLKIDAHGLSAVRLGNSDQLRRRRLCLAIGAQFGHSRKQPRRACSARPVRCQATVRCRSSKTGRLPSTRAIRADRSRLDGSRRRNQFADLHELRRVSGSFFRDSHQCGASVEQQIVKTGKVEHGRLGVEMQNVNQSLAESFRARARRRRVLWWRRWSPDSAAARAGIKPGDVIQIQRVADQIQLRKSCRCA